MTFLLAGFLGPIGLPELIVILVIVLLLFGSTRIPTLMRSMGQGLGEFKKGVSEGTKPDEPPKEGPPAPPPPAAPQ